MTALASSLAAKSMAVVKLGRDAFYAVWDQAEGVAAFAEKRPPVWRDR